MTAGPRDGRRRPPNHSRAWVDTVVCPVLLDAARISALLPREVDLELLPLPGVPAGRHPVIVELWRVHDGALETAGMDAHDWSDLAATAAGFGVGGGGGALAGAGVGGVAGAAGGGMLGMLLGPLGLAWGAAVGAAAGATTAAALGATAGAMWGARWAGGAARRASVAGSRVLGSYSEIMATIPCSRDRGAGGQPFAYVAGMYTDSMLSRMGERALGFGYRKRAARFSLAAHGGAAVDARSGQHLLDVAVDPREGGGNGDPTGDGIGSTVRAMLGRPLIGARSGERLAVSFLDRAFDAPSARLCPAAVTLAATPDFLGGLLAGRHRIAASSPTHPWGALVAAGLPVRLSYPRVLGRS